MKKLLLVAFLAAASIHGFAQVTKVTINGLRSNHGAKYKNTLIAQIDVESEKSVILKKSIKEQKIMPFPAIEEIPLIKIKLGTITISWLPDDVGIGIKKRK
jgi:hypothetical protein